MKTEKEKVINILIVDDHQMFIDGIRLLLNKVKGIRILAEAHNGREAQSIISGGGIDLVIADINMPEMNGIELTVWIKQHHPEIKVLVLSMYNDRATVQEIINAEAEGYILKNTGKQELLNAIQKLHDNGTYYSDEIRKIISTAALSGNRFEPLAELTDRELEVLRLICDDKTSAEIAEALFISIHTVDTHRKHICQKTGTRTILGLVRYAVENKLL
jgi:DNA-binding NarL/FixJ family response regulator